MVVPDPASKPDGGREKLNGSLVLPYITTITIILYIYILIE